MARQNTFHKCETVALENYEERNVEFKAKVCNVFKIEIIKKKNVAQINALTNNLKHNKPQFKDETFYTRQDYEFALKKNLAIANEVGFQIHNKKEQVYYDDCDNCQGTGLQACSKCNGSAILECGVCDGSGLQYEVTIFACSTNPKYDFNYPENLDKNILKMLKNTKNLPKIAHFVRESSETQNNKILEKYTISVPTSFFCFSPLLNFFMV